MKYSRNYVALKLANSNRYIMNGNWEIDWSGDFPGAGTVFKYMRPVNHYSGYQEHVFAKGPITEAVTLQILYQQRNHGVQYQYTLPIIGSRGSSGSSAFSGRNTQHHRNSRHGLGDDRDKSPDPSYAVNDVSRQTHGLPTNGDRSHQRTNSHNRGHNNNNRGHHGRRGHVSAHTGTDFRNRDRQRSQQQNPQTDLSLDFRWRVSGFTECSRTCGGGIQKTKVVCVASKSLAVVTDENCDAGTKPEVQTVPCGTNPCQPDWDIGPWSSCSVSCGEGKKTRIVECKQRISDTVTIAVSASNCIHKTRPASVDTCEKNPCYRWKIGRWGQCSVLCGKGKRRREVTCVDSNDRLIAENKCEGKKPEIEEPCEMGSCAKDWLVTKWSDQCSANCGEGTYKRTVYCASSAGVCDASQKPDEEKPCNTSRKCGGLWFTGPWSQCPTSCEETNRERDVICMRKQGRSLVLAMHSDCDIEEKPDSREKCEKKTCGVEWFLSDWGECSTTCGGGQKTRQVMCLTSNKERSTECPIKEKPRDTEDCNNKACPTEVPLDPSCQDRLGKQCRLIVQARLCNYEFYKQRCCHSCTKHDRHHHHRK